MSYWNYRIIRTTRDDAVSYGIHEVYYSDRNEIESWTEDSMRPLGESAGELRNDVFHFMSAFKYPALAEIMDDGKKRLVEDKETRAVTPAHHFELMDRASVVMAHFDEFVASHPAVKSSDRLKEAAQRTIDALYGFYGEAAEVFFRLDEADGVHPKGS